MEETSGAADAGSDREPQKPIQEYAENINKILRIMKNCRVKKQQRQQSPSVGKQFANARVFPLKARIRQKAGGLVRFWRRAPKGAEPTGQAERTASSISFGS